MKGANWSPPRWACLILAGLLALLLPAGRLQATPTIPVLIANHETRACGEVIEGDECFWCDPLPGWEVLGPAGNVTCPAGYAIVDRPPMDCRRLENAFCCTGGVRGDCENMVVNDATATCGFVHGLEGCALPDGWRGRQPEVDVAAWACPWDYRWETTGVACRVVTPTPRPVSQATSTVPADTEFEGSPWPTIWISLACLIVVAVLFGGAALFPIWYVQRQRERRTQPPKGR